ncbi:hypothetical protein FQN60_007878, partial [Etheostoma spectabile]
MYVRSSVSPRSACRSTPDAASSPGGPVGEGGPPAPAPNLTSNRRLQQTQAQVDEKLSELDDRADALQAGASQFESSAAKLKNKYWWKNCKMMIIMAVIGVICCGVIFWMDTHESPDRSLHLHPRRRRRRHLSCSSSSSSSDKTLHARSVMCSSASFSSLLLLGK